ncbi:hypothetical protein PCAR4_830020 [Paraburkholderia caribensis]|nr:hypothetical protein PCAR4_830020 [Paraburkholderia caribensis]
MSEFNSCALRPRLSLPPICPEEALAGYLARQQRMRPASGNREGLFTSVPLGHDFTHQLSAFKERSLYHRIASMHSHMLIHVFIAREPQS